MSDHYTLYGSYASYYTAKARTYLRKKGVPFVERLPSDPMFRNKVRPASGSHRIPQLLTPTGDVIQDSVAIVDHIEPLFPDLPAFPDSPNQRIFVHLMELLGSEGLVRLAWMHRWMFEENLPFVINDFGRSFKPQGSDEDLQHYGNLIADRMRSYGLPESTPELREQLDDSYKRLLTCFEKHFIEHPYLLGGHPSAADYAVMGALHAHLGRDPAGLRVMQIHAPRTFRFVEHMLVPEVQSPEFYSTAIEYPANDDIPGTALDILRHIATEYGEPFVLGALAFNADIAEQDPSPGSVLDAEKDQPTLPAHEIVYRDKRHKVGAPLYAIRLLQRSQQVFQELDDDAKKQLLVDLNNQTLTDLLTTTLAAELARNNNRFEIAGESNE